MAVLHIARFMLDIYLMQHFIVAWRVWLTDRLTGDWLEGRAYYRGRFIDNTIDNPDQRIQQDIDVFTAGVGATPNVPSNGTGSVLLFGAVNAMLSVVSFTAILWNLSGPLDLFGFSLPKAMFWIVIVYVLLATIVGVLDRASADLAQLPQRAHQRRLPLCAGAGARRRRGGRLLPRRARRTRAAERPVPPDHRQLSAVCEPDRSAGSGLELVDEPGNRPAAVGDPSTAAVRRPDPFGDVTQTAAAFGNIQDGLSFFRNAYDAVRRAIARRSSGCNGLVEADEKARELPELLVRASADGAVDIEGVEVRTPDGDQLIDPLDVHLTTGDALVITGPSGSGKTTLLRSLAQLWPYAIGDAALPRRRQRQRCSCPSCPMCRWAICGRWCPIRRRKATFPTMTSARCWPR